MTTRIRHMLLAHAGTQVSLFAIVVVAILVIGRVANSCKNGPFYYHMPTLFHYPIHCVKQFSICINFKASGTFRISHHIHYRVYYPSTFSNLKLKLFYFKQHSWKLTIWLTYSASKVSHEVRPTDITSEES